MKEIPVLLQIPVLAILALAVLVSTLALLTVNTAYKKESNSQGIRFLCCRPNWSNNAVLTRIR
jgi:hypothetical protein